MIAVISNYAALRAYTHVSGTDEVYVEGYSTAQDGGQGTFVWNSSSTATDNDGTIIKDTNTTGRWIRLYPSGSVDVKWFGAKGDGTTNDRPAVEKAINYAVTQLTTRAMAVLLPAGVYYFNSVETSPPSGFSNRIGIGLPVNIGVGYTDGVIRELIIHGSGKDLTTIKLSDNCRNAFWIEKVANYDIFRNVTIQDLSIDNDFQPGACHILIGNMPSSNTKQTYLSFENILIQNGLVYNCDVDETQVISKGSVFFCGAHASDGETPQTFSKNITLNNWVQEGADFVGFIACTNLANHFHDDINYLNSQHLIPNAPGSFFSQVSFIVGGGGFGDRFTMQNCYSENVADVSYEINDMKSGLIANCKSRNAHECGMLFRNYRTADDIADYKMVINEQVIEFTTDNVGAGLGIAFISDNLATFGSFAFNDLKYTAAGLKTSLADSDKGYLVYSSTTNTCRQIDFMRPKVTITDYVYDVDNTRDVSCFLIDSTEGMICNITDLELIVSATITSEDEDARLNFAGVKVSGGHLNLNGYAADFSNVISGGINHIFPAGLTVAKDADAGDVHHQNIKLNVTELYIVGAANTANMHGVNLYGAVPCDYFNLSGCYLKFSPGTDIYLGSSPTYPNITTFICENNVLNTDSVYGSLATGDIFYRNSVGRLIRLAVGTTNQVLSVVSGVPTWGNELGSGSYTPGLSNVANMASGTANQCIFTRVGITAIVSGSLTFTPTAAATLTKINIDLPVASTFTATNKVSGLSVLANGTVGTLVADVTNNKATLILPAPPAGSQLATFNFQYRIQ